MKDKDANGNKFSVTFKELAAILVERMKERDFQRTGETDPMRVLEVDLENFIKGDRLDEETAARIEARYAEYERDPQSFMYKKRKEDEL